MLCFLAFFRFFLSTGDEIIWRDYSAWYICYSCQKEEEEEWMDGCWGMEVYVYGEDTGIV